MPFCFLFEVGCVYLPRYIWLYPALVFALYDTRSRLLLVGRPCTTCKTPSGPIFNARHLMATNAPVRNIMALDFFRRDMSENVPFGNFTLFVAEYWRFENRPGEMMLVLQSWDGFQCEGKQQHLFRCTTFCSCVACCAALSTQAMCTESRQPALPMASPALRAQAGEARRRIAYEQNTSSTLLNEHTHAVGCSGALEYCLCKLVSKTSAFLTYICFTIGEGDFQQTLGSDRKDPSSGIRLHEDWRQMPVNYEQFGV